MSSRLVVLGSCGAWPQAGRACSGYLIEHEGFRVVLDLGYATLPRLLAALGSTVAEGLDAVVVTHRHFDHAVDVHGLFRARYYGRPGGAPLALYAGEGVLEMVAALEEGEMAAVSEVFDHHLLPAGPYQVGPFELTSVALPHFVPNAGVRLSSPGLTVAYTGDTGPDPALADLGRGADLYIVEATDRYQQGANPPSRSGPALDLDARQAGHFAAAAGARRLLLTHFWPGNDRQASRAAAEEVFPGEVIIAEEDLEITLP